jgi:hypothetical protein
MEAAHNFRFYQCVDKPFQTITCMKVEYGKYEILPDSQLHFVAKILPEFLDPLILKYKTIKKIVINKKN